MFCVYVIIVYVDIDVKICLFILVNVKIGFNEDI